MSQPKTFEEAKALADQTYIQFWQDKADAITDKWTAEDYALLDEPRYEDVKIGVDPKRRIYRTEQRQVLPEGYEELQEINSYIEKGPLDFTSKETYDLLIRTPKVKGGTLPTKQQYWIEEDEPLRQAVEAQSEVMQNFLDSENISIVKKYEDIEGFERPDSFRGEGVYLNTGTGAHIDWDSSLKRGQNYQSSPTAELGTYSQVFVRPDPEGLAKPLAFVASITGNPWLSAASTVAAGGDLEDAIKGAATTYAAGQITAPILEDTLSVFGVDADLFGIDPEEFSESVQNIQETMLEGGSGEDAFIKELGGAAVKQVGKTVDDMLPDIDLETPQIFKDLEDVVKTTGGAIDDTVIQPLIEPIKPALTAVGNVVEEGAKAVGELGQDIIDPVDEVIDTIGGSDIVEAIEEGGKKVGELGQDIIDTGSDITSEIEDVVKDAGRAIDDIVDWEGLLKGLFGIGGTGGMMSGARKPSQVEGLFDKELFKFDTEIKSTQEILSPMMNKKRRYG